LAELLSAALAEYAATNPWVDEYELRPKSVVREMAENAMTFSELISKYQIARSEGVVLRYLSEAYKALRQVVPPAMGTEEPRSALPGRPPPPWRSARQRRGGWASASCGPDRWYAGWPRARWRCRS